MSTERLGCAFEPGGPRCMDGGRSCIEVEGAEVNVGDVCKYLSRRLGGEGEGLVRGVGVDRLRSRLYGLPVDMMAAVRSGFVS